MGGVFPEEVGLTEDGGGQRGRRHILPDCDCRRPEDKIDLINLAQGQNQGKGSVVKIPGQCMPKEALIPSFVVRSPKII